MSETATRKPKSELHLRVISGIVLAIAGIGSTWLGGWVFLMIWTAISLIVAYEWLSITKNGQSTPDRSSQNGLLLAGFFYAAALFWSVILLRLSQQNGMVAIFFLFAVVWAADVFAYFAGRTFGGPKLAPRISPKKTWSGMIGGLAGAVIAGLGLLWLADMPFSPIHIGIALILGLASVAGDLFESAFKRKFGVKDSGRLIPGHGGFMDRLDGFIIAAACAALIGIARGGVSNAATGLLVW